MSIRDAQRNEADLDSVTQHRQSRLVGCLLGTAVGDALGLPYEGLSRRRAARLFGPPDRYRFVFGRGMVSDDTEHACLVAQALIASGGDVEWFRRSLARSFRWWLLGVPAGVGLATLRSIVRLWLGFSPQNSGVFSAGNGPAMRAAILGAAIDDRGQLRELVAASSRITHTDPKAEWGALAVALAAHMACRSANGTVQGGQFLAELQTVLGGEGDELLSLIGQAVGSVDAGQSSESFAESLGLTQGVSGYVYHTVPVAIHAWLAHPRDFHAAVTAVIRCGGDTDSTAAIVGGIVGAGVGREGIPQAWLDGLCEWPRTSAWMERLARELAMVEKSGTRRRPPRLPVWGVLLRNAFFLPIVLFHGFRRLLPPY
jgi:ADP-ribosyl-[dinitrogen reductase] hydrolase